MTEISCDGYNFNVPEDWFVIRPNMSYLGHVGRILLHNCWAEHLLLFSRSCLLYGVDWIECGLVTLENLRGQWLDSHSYARWTMFLRYFSFYTFSSSLNNDLIELSFHIFLPSWLAGLIFSVPKPKSAGLKLGELCSIFNHVFYPSIQYLVNHQHSFN